MEIVKIVAVIVAYLFIGVLCVRPSKAIYNLVEPRIGDAIPTVMFWPFVLLICLMHVKIPRRLLGKDGK